MQAKQTKFSPCLLFFKALCFLFLILQGREGYSQFSQEDTAAMFKTFSGGYLHFSGGLLRNNSHDLRTTFNNGGPFDEKTFEFENINYGPSIGLGTQAIFENNLLLGGKGEFTFIANNKNDIGKVSLNAFSALLTMGKAMKNSKGTFIYPYIGVGFFKYFLSIENVSASDTSVIRFDALTPIYKGEKQKFTSNAPLFELGVGFKRIIGKNFNLGAELGIYFSATTRSLLKRDGKDVDFREAPGVNGGFIRITADLYRYGKKQYIDTLAPPVFIPEATAAADKPKEDKKAEKKAKKKKSDTKELAEKEKKTETVSDKKEESASSASSKKSSSSKKKKKPASRVVRGQKVNVNENLFDFGNKPKPETPATPSDTTKSKKNP